MHNIKKILFVTPVTQRGDRDIKEQNVCIKLKSDFYQFKIDYYFKMFYILSTMNTNYLQKIHTKNNEQELSKLVQIINKTQIKTVREGKRVAIRHTENNKMTLVSPCLLVIALNVNGLNFPIKNHRLAG